MSAKLTVAVLMGGKSSEHKISLMSGIEVAKNLDREKYLVKPMTISKDGKSFQLKGKNYNFSQLSTVNCQLFFIAMHGPFGEDGTIQGFLELMGVDYTGSGVLASALGMDKIYSRKLFTQADLTVPRYTLVRKKKNQNIVAKNLKFPVFVKPNNQGSSVGTSKVKDKKDLASAIKDAHRYSDFALIEEFIDGIEVTAAIIGNDKPKALPLVEIIPKRDFFDYKAKYDEKLTDEIVPARIGKTLTQKAQDAALIAYKTIGCRGFGRVDMIIKGHDVYVLEVNTIPGLTSVSLLPKAAKAAGISYSQLLDKIISFATP